MSDFEIFVKLLCKAEMNFTTYKSSIRTMIRVFSDTDSLDFFFDANTEEIQKKLT